MFTSGRIPNLLVQLIKYFICLGLLLGNLNFAKAEKEQTLYEQMQILTPTDTNFVVQKDTMVSKHFLQKKIIVSVMAFPFPFGFVGAHRVMLGTKPYVPIVYVATLGGCFGLLPLIDFIVIATSKNLEQYENNSSIFMWIK
jgi:TM2 domain-containing membrane protein YozV